MDDDAVSTDPDFYSVVFENERVRVLEYRDTPGAKTNRHHHPDSVMIPLSAFERRLEHGSREADISFEPGAVRWVPEESHVGENIGSTDSHAILVELKEPSPGGPSQDASPGPAVGG
ncbi:cytoplasmic protein [Agrococcus sp. DT81.2]|uniref:cytoplasmic protein n=1 Tax=Agrococcus sp. DT81.2 TaxID=3393414 RepID=UPI003CE4CDF8